MHAVSKGMKVAVVAGGDVGGTCVNRGCVPSKALLAASGKVREIGNKDHLAAMGVMSGGVTYEREKVAAHANDLASKVAKNLGNSLDALGVTVFPEKGQLVSPTEVSLVGSSKTVSAKNVILATGSVPFVPPGVETDGKTVFTSDEALKLEWVPDYIAIIGSGYIGLEFSDVYTALGSEVTFIEAMPRIMFFFDKQIAQLAERILIRPRDIDYRTNVFASKVTPGACCSTVLWHAADAPSCSHASCIPRACALLRASIAAHKRMPPNHLRFRHSGRQASHHRNDRCQHQGARRDPRGRRLHGVHGPLAIL